MFKLLLILILSKKLKRIKKAFDDQTYDEWLSEEETVALHDLEAWYRIQKNVGFWELVRAILHMDKALDEVDRSKEENAK